MTFLILYINIIETAEDKNFKKRLRKITEWRKIWLLKFHPNKCKHIVIGRTEPNSEFEYSFMARIFRMKKDIGVTTDNKLSFE